MTNGKKSNLLNLLTGYVLLTKLAEVPMPRVKSHWCVCVLCVCECVLIVWCVWTLCDIPTFLASVLHIDMTLSEELWMVEQSSFSILQEREREIIQVYLYLHIQ